ncbi:hypothetical protein L596_030039 [Steinernema carpocapsae]|uniref:Uncharacterized protein n=1 Tax=Steinernema carpocapsae TaxID=34508 RepID=A0A4V5ZX70_STECR|nr:hypothetical protein L596_030039 [Steinernema carpocapsae]
MFIQFIQNLENANAELRRSLAKQSEVYRRVETRFNRDQLTTDSSFKPIRPLLENDAEEILEDLTLEDAGDDLETFREKWKAELERNKKKEEANELGKGREAVSGRMRPREGGEHERGREELHKGREAPKGYGQGPSTSKKLRNDEETEALDLNLVFNERLDQRNTYFLSEDKNCPLNLLPTEVLRLITRYVVGAGLDTRSLENLSMTSVHFYLVARENEIWHRICRKTFDLPKNYVSEFPSWREMYLWTPHLQFYGVYVAKITYVRNGETGFQDKFYRPWHMVTYYRLLRFFANGCVLMITTPENLSNIVGSLRTPQEAKNVENVLVGSYWNNGSSISMKLTQLIHRKKTNRKPQIVNSKRLQGYIAPHELVEKNFHIELRFSDRRSKAHKNHGILLWTKYEYSHVLVDGSISKGDFHVVDSQTYPPFYLSRVKSFAVPEGFDEVLE